MLFVTSEAKNFRNIHKTRTIHRKVYKNYGGLEHCEDYIYICVYIYIYVCVCACVFFYLFIYSLLYLHIFYPSIG